MTLIELKVYVQTLFATDNTTGSPIPARRPQMLSLKAAERHATFLCKALRLWGCHGHSLLRALPKRNQVLNDSRHTSGRGSQSVHRVLLDGACVDTLAGIAERPARDLSRVAEPSSAAIGCRFTFPEKECVRNCPKSSYCARSGRLTVLALRHIVCALTRQMVGARPQTS